MKIIALTAILSLLLTSCGAQAKPQGDYMRIDQDRAADIMASGEEHIILDVRRPDEFAAGHIPGAVNIPNETIGSEDIAQLPDKEAVILVYCRSGNRSKQASAKLAAMGYTNIMEFGGINSWTGEIVTD